MAKFRIRAPKQDEELQSRVLELNIGSKTTKTPSRALYFRPHDKFCEAEAMHKKQLRGINEIYIQRNYEELQELRSELPKQTRLIGSYENAYQKQEIGSDELIYAIMHYDARHSDERSEFLNRDRKKPRKQWKRNPRYIRSRLPRSEDIGYLLRLYASIPSDVVIPPILEGADADTYITFLEKYFELKDSYAVLDDKPIMGLIPNVSDLELPQILDFYSKKEVRLYAIDFHGSQPLLHKPNLIAIIQYFKRIEKEYNELSYLHGLNVRYGRMLEKEKLPARDILSFSAGVDSFGTTHFSFGGTTLELEGTPEQKRKLKLQDSLRKLALFNRSDYGYHKFQPNKNLKTIFKQDDEGTIFNIAHIERAESAEEARARARIFNAERHGIEARNLAKEVVGEEKMKDYLRKKTLVDDKLIKDLSRIGRARDEELL